MVSDREGGKTSGRGQYIPADRAYYMPMRDGVRLALSLCLPGRTVPMEKLAAIQGPVSHSFLRADALPMESDEPEQVRFSSFRLLP